MSIKIVRLIIIYFSVFYLSSCATHSSVAVKPPNIKWQYVGETHWGDIRHFVNQETIQRKSAGIIHLQSKNRLKTPETISFLKGKKYTYDINNWEINCQRKTIKLLSAIYYDALNQVIFNYEIKTPKSNTIPKGSILYQLYKIGCAIR